MEDERMLYEKFFSSMSKIDPKLPISVRIRIFMEKEETEKIAE